MTKKPFLAGQWLAQEPQAADRAQPEVSLKATSSASAPATIRSHFPSFTTRRRPARAQIESAVAQGFRPAHFLTPGWDGGALTCRLSSRYVRLLDGLAEDVRQRLCSHEFNRSLKLGIYNEFLPFAEGRGLASSTLADPAGFWQAVKDPALHTEELRTFLDLFCARVAVITLFKLRFIRVLAHKAGLEAGPKAAHNPNHWLSNVFQPGTRRELKARVMESHVFSWYRPGDEMGPQVAAWLEDCGRLSITELIKHASPRVQGAENRVYSHALSHINFGLFLNSLMINFPLWVETWDPANALRFRTPEELEIISCKYGGDFLESLAHSHWLAQDNNKDMKWDQILCPDFKGPAFEAGAFLKMFNELQFLTFLAEMAPLQGQEPVGFISKVMGGHYQNRKGLTGRAGHAFDTPFATSTYDRSVLNLCQLPKNNPYHWMMAQIHAEEENLKPGGYLFVLAPKSLFAPSQKDRLGQLLNGLELKAVFEMENLQGKGELGAWLYVFRRRQPAHPRLADVRENVAWFRFSAEMGSFHDFTGITESLRTFYLGHLSEVPPMWQQEWEGGFRVEFFQEALLDGHLIHAAHEDQSRITHPRFFKSLMDNSVPLDSVFELRTIEPSEWSAPAGMGLGLRREGATFIVIDLRDPARARAELLPAETFRAVYYDRGAAQCHYFAVAPRGHGMDPNVLRQYFESPVGQQLLGLASGNGQHIKAQLGKMLVPKWFLRGDFLPASLAPALELFDYSAERLTGDHPESLRERWQQFRGMSHALFPRYACDVMGAVGRFTHTLGKLVEDLEDPRQAPRANFTNPLLLKALAGLPVQPLLPHHPDVYVELTGDATPPEAPLRAAHLRSMMEGDLRTWHLDLETDAGVPVRLHADESLLSFAQFVLQGARGVPVPHVLRALRLPGAAPLRLAMEANQDQGRVLAELLAEARAFVDESFRHQFVTRTLAAGVAP